MRKTAMLYDRCRILSVQQVRMEASLEIIYRVLIKVKNEIEKLYSDILGSFSRRELELNSEQRRISKSI